MSAKVYLVGAGPGDPELLTVKALRVLQAADVVLYDELVSPEILSLIPAEAEIVNVGKRSGGRYFPQQEICVAMIAYARRGKRVVRLKGGDPSIFGRAGEEIEALRLAGIRFEIVPGVTAALAAAASGAFSLTDRRLASSVLFLSGHSSAGNDAADWTAAVNSGATLVIYMPGNPSAVSESLQRAGLDPETPCAVVVNASLTGEQVKRRPLRNLWELDSAGKPKLLIVGTVVGAAVDKNHETEAGTSERPSAANRQLMTRCL
jgi:uroporphyrin-III C-methyltransferase